MLTSIPTQVLWLGGLILQAAILFGLWHRRLYRDLPIFFSYTAFLIVRSLVLYVVHGASAWGYFYGYWIGEVLSWAWGLAVIQEVMQRLFQSYAAVQRLVVVLFRWAAVLLIVVAAFAAYAAPGSNSERLIASFLVLERSVRIIQVGLLSLLFVFAGFLRLRWPHYIFGIALGFGVFCSAELAAITVRTHDMWTHDAFTLLKPLAFVVAQGVWIFYIAVPERSPAAAARPAPQMEGWNMALMELLRR